MIDVDVCTQAELESLNSAADSINKLENELQVSLFVSVAWGDRPRANLWGQLSAGLSK